MKHDGETTYVEPVGTVSENVVSVDGGIAVFGAKGKTIVVYTMLGSLVSKVNANSHMTSVPLRSGTYMVKVGNNAYKSVVR